MKQLLTVITLATLFAFTGKQTESYVYIFRDGQFFAAGNNYSIWIDGKKICKLSNGKYIKYALPPGNHEIEARVGGMALNKKETHIYVEVKPGQSHYISCTVKRSITRQRMEMIEVVESAGKKELQSLKPDNCQEDFEEK